MNPCFNAQSLDRPGHLAFWVVLPPEPELLQLCPAGNRIGTMLLRRLLIAALSARLGEAPEVMSFFELNMSQTVIAASQLRVALEVVAEELGTLGLLTLTHLVWHDAEEGVWRTHPAGVNLPDRLTETVMDREAFDASRREFLAIAARLRFAAERLNQQGSNLTDEPRQ